MSAPENSTELLAPEVRRLPIPSGVELLWLFESDRDLKQHPVYAQAKAGDAAAAVQLISDLALASIYAERDRFGQDAIFVAPFAREAAGDNAIPQVLAEVAAMVCGAHADQQVVQVTRVYHTGADPMERLALRAAFEGQVQAGGTYVLVDDVVSLGGTLAELAHFIQSKGGMVKAIFVLVNAGRNKAICPERRQLKILHERYGHEFEKIFGICVDALTANEASYLVGFRSVDEIRNRLAKAKQEINLCLRSKGIPGLFG